jgi:hypothetical protein
MERRSNMPRKNSEKKRERVVQILKQHGPLTCRGIIEQWAKTPMRNKGENTNKTLSRAPTVNSLSNLLRNYRFVVIGQVAGSTSLFRDRSIRAAGGGRHSSLVNVYGLRQDEEE